MKKIQIPECMTEKFKKNLEILNKKQVEFGLPLTTAKMIGEPFLVPTRFTYHEAGESHRFDSYRTMNIPFVEYEVENFELVKKEGYTYLGTRTIKDGASIVYCVDKDSFEEVAKDINVCDHCHTQRTRNQYHIFKADDGRILRIGNTCCRDYFGWDVNQMVNLYMRTYFIFGSYDYDYDEFKKYFCYGWDAVYDAAKKDTHDFLSWKKDEFLYEVSETGSNSIHKEELDKIRDYWSRQHGDFAWNCVEVLKLSGVTARNLTMAYAAIFFGHKGLMKEEAARVEMLKQPVYELGQKIEFKGVVERNTVFETQFGCSHLIIINSDGIRYKMFTAASDIRNLEVNTKVEIKGTFSGMDEFNGMVQQIVKRPKLISMEKPEEELPAVDGEKEFNKFWNILEGATQDEKI